MSYARKKTLVAHIFDILKKSKNGICEPDLIKDLGSKGFDDSDEIKTELVLLRMQGVIAIQLAFESDQGARYELTTLGENILTTKEQSEQIVSDMMEKNNALVEELREKMQSLKDQTEKRAKEMQQIANSIGEILKQLLMG